jgi:glucan 1,3-beta-glucosidase
MTKQLRGVNLGGWLVVEKWMTPRLFEGTDAVDEYTLMQSADSKSRIEKHRQTFITEKDFIWLKEYDIQLVRIPVGYWLFESVDGFAPSLKYLDQAMKWAEKYGIQALICLHGARGSQNGFDNSGRAGSAEWFANKSYQNETLELLERVAERYSHSPILWGIELLNEPTPRRHYFTLLKFHRRAFSALTKILRPQTHIIYHDAFQPLLFLGTFWKWTSHPVMMDSHWYGFEFKTNDFHGYLDKSARLRRWLLRITQLWQPVIVGEWSTVLPQRFFDQVPESEHMNMLKQNAVMQQREYKRAAGWIYWNYKHEGGGMWNFRDLVERGIIDPRK